MAPLDQSVFEHKVRSAYELGRVRLAVWHSLPVLALSALVWTTSPRVPMLFAVAAALLLLNGLSSWRGLDFAIGARAGLAAGAIPLSVSLAARYLGHLCTPAGCLSWCVPACAAGGAIAAIVVALGAKKAKAPFAYWAAASVVTTLTGSLACGCVGMYGIAALAVAFTVSSLPASYLAARA